MQKNESYEGLASEFLSEWISFLDFIWKSEDLLDFLKEKEIAKADEYFPNDPFLKKARIHLEFGKLERDFPKYINYSSLMIGVSIIESYLLKICEEEKSLNSRKLGVRDINGQGVKKYLNYLVKVCDVDESRISYSVILRVKVHHEFAG